MAVAPGLDFYHRYTAAAFIARAVEDCGRYELVEGTVIARRRPSIAHTIAERRLWAQLDRQLPPDFLAVSEIEVDLQLSVPASPSPNRSR